MRSLLAGMFLFALGGVFAARAAENIRNEKVIVSQDAIAPGSTRTVAGNLPSLTIYTQGGDLEVFNGGAAP
jgi:hypothetical protein